MSSEAPWFEVAFGELYPVLYAHRDDASAAGETEFTVRTLDLEPGDRVLDLGCGGGRHLRGLSAAGITAVGMDLSKALLDDNAARGGERLVRADMRRLPFGPGTLDAVVSFFTSFGYFASDHEDRLVLREVARVVRPGGRYLLDYLDAREVGANVVPRSEKTVGGYQIVEARRIEDGRVKKQVWIRRTSDGEEAVAYEESVRLYSPAELEAMIDAVGFDVRKRFGALDGRALGEGGRCVIAAVRR
ncbi:MAG: SAM-dependent methyltransferase [Planctomycetes bacterium]|nr:SAM-dependent methyltransferase [Planctomycetota bacterium]